MSVINTNYLSLVAQNNLQKSQSALGTAIERLSSGLRINSAKDDAAGQAIANRMGAQINGLNQAARNANDGISAAQTTEGALNQINDNLQRIRVLTVQASNGTNSGEDLTSIQNEIGQRLQEINRISSETEFNGVKVLASDEELTIQVGANDGQTITINLAEINAQTLGLNGFNVDSKAEIANTKATKADLDALVDDLPAEWAEAGGVYTNTRTNDAVDQVSAFSRLGDQDTVAVNDGTVTTTYTFDADKGSFTYDQTFDATSSTDLAGVIADLKDAIGAGAKTDVSFKVGANGTVKAANGDALYNDNGVLTSAPTDPAATEITDLDELLGFAAVTQDAELTVDGVTYTTTTADAGADEVVMTVAGLSMSSAELQSLVADNTGGSTTVSYGAAGGSVVTGSVTLGADGKSTTQYVDANGTFTTNATSTVDYKIDAEGSVIVDSGNQKGAIAYISSTGDVTTEATSQGDRTENPLDVLDTALAQVDALRSDLGAIQNRFESAITNLQTTSNNLAAAQSRIQDADYSVEVANMTRAQILQQAGTSVLAQANQIPQGVLSLLR
ncbi:flagellin [Pusillimonas sp. NJUB218]|uniref:flagellin N-terminal helical domain-containing protein n=1 Tax=Pusillimonas sp. NJUB218 TaxID=2023230 RepID=UPI000F4B7A01|nr:flagellin [Pusillimonas sp. NJUB218]ROT44314.1 hypothetical protein CHR62_13430 [Pusillimonas sp. NJUB218]